MYKLSRWYCTQDNLLNIIKWYSLACPGESSFHSFIVIPYILWRQLKRRWSRESIHLAFYDKLHKLFYSKEIAISIAAVYSNNAQKIVTSVKSIVNHDSFNFYI